jgi:hypothetical protein
MYAFPISQPFAQPYSVGGGGNGGNGGPIFGNPGNAGGNTVLTNVGTTNAGGGGRAGPSNAPGTSGNAPGASLTYPSRSLLL